MGLDQSLYRVSKVTKLDLENWKALSSLSDEEASYRTAVVQDEFIKVPPSLQVVAADRVEGYKQYHNLRPYFTEVDLYDYGGSEHLRVYTFNMEELACWRNDYELQDAMHTICTKEIKNTGYYLCDEDMLVAIKDNLKAKGEDPDFDPENWDEESLFYWEWY